MRKRLLCFVVILICCGAITGFTDRRMSEEEAGVEYEYDELNRVIKETYPNGTIIIYRYDKNGNLLETIVSALEETDAANTGTGESNAVNYAANYAVNYAVNYAAAGDARGQEDIITGNPSMETDAIDLEKTEVQEILPDEANRNMAEHSIVPGIAVQWGAGWLIIIVLMVVLTGGAVWKIRRSRLNREQQSKD